MNRVVFLVMCWKIKVCRTGRRASVGHSSGVGTPGHVWHPGGHRGQAVSALPILV